MPVIAPRRRGLPKEENMEYPKPICANADLHGGAWNLYDKLIEGVPEGICVKDYCLGTAWSYVDAECGMGVAYTDRGGAKRGTVCDLRGIELREMAKLSKSWSFKEATLGIAALNAWYSNPKRLEALGVTYDDDEAVAGNETVVGDSEDGGPRCGKRMDAFDVFMPRVDALGGKAKVVIVGHFPRVERFTEHGELVVLERNCRDEWDTPDPACEYVMPQADFAFITGVTLINKTAPRLLQLCKDACTVMVGPSVVMSPVLFDYGVDSLSGSVVGDPEAARFAVQNGAGKFFGRALRMCSMSR